MYSSYSWERHYKADGWMLKSSGFFKQNYGNSDLFKGYYCEGVSKFLKINYSFIHPADVGILKFKQLMMDNSYSTSAMTYLREALSHWVITSEVNS